ncbi:hypothetical protein [Endozoicomonas atrinae]|uniref:hypothetical protein n=1 Tax=Endozoicomonas atrinae TaxID=1333660 RepID=UPI003B008B3D
MPFPFDIPDNEKSELISKILKYTTRTQEENAQLKERVNILEQEIHRLKGLNGKPDIKPNTPKNDDSSQGKIMKPRTRRGLQTDIECSWLPFSAYASNLL